MTEDLCLCNFCAPLLATPHRSDALTTAIREDAPTVGLDLKQEQRWRSQSL